MRGMAKSYYQQREDEIKIIIAEAKIRHNLTDEELSKKIGMPFNTFNKKKLHPGELRGRHIWLLESLAGKVQS